MGLCLVTVLFYFIYLLLLIFFVVKQIETFSGIAEVKSPLEYSGPEY